jgi:hypothetical protein
LARLHHRLEAEGLGRLFDGRLNEAPPAAADELTAVADRLRALVGAVLEPPA